MKMVIERRFWGGVTDFKPARNSSHCSESDSVIAKVQFWVGFNPDLKGFTIGQVPFELGWYNMDFGQKSFSNFSKKTSMKYKEIRGFKKVAST